ncbi:hypothetical protein C0995_001148 [Termitomyces sp. Mi166|nr:hypothetical protein C0995_001148 [Termitomyces sp. Mi166\
MDPDHTDEKWASLPLPDPQLSAGRSSRPRRDSHSRRHHRDREGSTKSKIRDTIERDLYVANNKMDKIQAENDLLLDAIYAASPELMDLVSPILAPRQLPPHPHSHPPPHPHPHPHAQAYPNPNSTPYPYPQGPIYDPPPRAQGRFSPGPGPGLHSPSVAPNDERGYEHDQDYEMRDCQSPRVLSSGRMSSASFPAQDSAVVANGHLRTNASAHADLSVGENGNGVVPPPMQVQGLEPLPAPENEENAMR